MLAESYRCHRLRLLAGLSLPQNDRHNFSHCCGKKTCVLVSRSDRATIGLWLGLGLRPSLRRTGIENVPKNQMHQFIRYTASNHDEPQISTWTSKLPVMWVIGLVMVRTSVPHEWVT